MTAKIGGSRTRRGVLAGAMALAGVTVVVTAALPPVPQPVENPITEGKRVLGKILFWDEQLSSDNTTSCGTCHRPEAGGADTRIGHHPGLDLIPGTPDDIFGSPGVIHADEFGDYEPTPAALLAPQTGTRTANPVINAAYGVDLFWDGRAFDQFIDPETGLESISTGGGLESQAVQPPFNTAEMAHEGRDWAAIESKLGSARPLALAGDLPADVDAVLAGDPSYPELFEAAFGTPEITAERIAFAIATYERTLVSDQSPWDDFMAGNPSAMTPAQVRGWNVFDGAGQCSQCHLPPTFSNNAFHNIGLRPVPEDTGRQGVTGIAAHRGQFKTPGLRNTNLKRNFMHNGEFTTLQQVMDFYVQGPGAPPRFPDNLDPRIIDINVTPAQLPDVIAFMDGGLTDPRVVAGTVPFDRPTLYSERATPNPALMGGGRVDSLGRVPQMIAVVPPNLGNDAFKVGVANVSNGYVATLAISTQAPVAGEVLPDSTVGPVTCSDTGELIACATAHWPIPSDGALDGTVYYMQWRVDDGSGGEPALSRVARVELFCGNGVCAAACPADIDGNGTLNLDDVNTFAAAFVGGDLLTDLDGSGTLNLDDVNLFAAGFVAGCP
ncbi:MAG: cytochrome c peroxidase [Phycisphaerales bacterium]